MLGLQSRFGVQITPDYTHSVRDVYRNFIKEYVAEVQNLGFLRYTEKTLRGSLDLPTFVPNWIGRRKTRDFPPTWTHAGKAAEAVIRDPSGRKLRVQAVPACRVSNVFLCPMRASNSPEDRHRDLFQWFDDLRETLPHLNDAQTDSLCRTICCNSFGNAWDMYVTNATFDQARGAVQNFMRRETHIPGGPNGLASRDVTWVIQRLCTSRSLFLTADDRFGLGSISTPIGDMVVVIPGCSSPMILRPSDLASAEYEVICDAWVDGLMYGEAVLGALPEHYVWKGDTDGSPLGFLHRQTGNFEIEDPRLPALPPGWQQVSKKTAETDALYRHSDTLEERKGVGNDPRLDIEFLKRRGVRFEEFVLL